MSGQFQFQEPLWLLLLILLPVLTWLGGKSLGKASIGFPTLRVLGSLGRKVTEKPMKIRWPLTFFAIILAILAMARPAWTNSETTREASGIETIIALDTSGSMDTPDFFEQSAELRRAETRLNAAKRIISGFVEARPDDRFSLLSFATNPYVLSPFSLHHDHLQDRLENLKTETAKSARTAIGSAIATAATRLDPREAKSKIIILVTDGENNAGSLAPLEAAKLASELRIRIYPVALSDEAEPLLRDMAETTGGEFHLATSFDSLQEAFSSIDRLEKSTAEITTHSEERPLHLYFLLASLALAIVSLSLRSLNPGPLP